MTVRKSAWIELDEEEVFWRGYCEIEETKHLGKCSKLGTLLSFLQQLLHPADDPDEKSLSIYVISKTQKVVVWTLMTNFFVLLFFVILAQAKRREEGVEGPSIESRKAWGLYNVGWLIICALCLGYYAALALDRRRPLFAVFHSDAVDAINCMGLCILLARALILLQSIGVIFDNKRCMEDEQLHPNDHTFMMIFSRIVFDMLQICFISLVPIPRLHVFALCLVEGIAQTARLLSCSERFFHIPGDPMFVYSVAIPILPYYLLLAALPTFTLHQSIKASYQHMLSLRDASEEKKQLVNMICSDLKVPVQQTKQLLKASQAIKLSSSESDVLDGCLMSITSVVDHVVFLMRVHEGRFAYHCGDRMRLVSVVSDAVRRLKYSAGVSRDDIFKLDVPDVDLHSNRHSLDVLLFYTMNAALIRFGIVDTSAKPLDLIASIHGSTLNVAIYSAMVPFDAHFLKNTADDVVPPANDSMRHFQTCLMFCKQIALACGGSFSCSASGRFIRFALPVEKVATRDSGCNSSFRPTITQLELSVIKELCVYSADPSLCSLSVQALQSIVPIEYADDVPVYEHLNMADMHVRSIVVVTSLQACTELRNKRYVGSIVLMSDRLVYLDDTDRLSIDHAVSLPSTPEQMDDLSKWLNGGGRSDLSSGMLVSIGLKPSDDRSSFLPAISPSIKVNYWRWRLLNPTGFLAHHTNTIIAVFVLVAAVLIIVNIISEQRWGSMVMVFSLAGLVLVRRCKDTMVVNTNWFHSTVILLNCVVVVVPIFQLYWLWSSASEGRPLKMATLPDVHSAQEFMVARYNASQTGSSLILVIIMSFASSKVMAEALFWPYSMIGCLVVPLHPFMVVRLLFAFVEANKLLYLVVVLLLGYLLVIGLLLCTERLRRREFLELREFVLSRDFLERSIAACWRDTLHPMTILTGMQEEMLATMCDRAIEREQRVKLFQNKMYLNLPLLESIEKMSYNTAMSKEVLYEMRMNLQSSVAKDASALILSMDLYLLKPIVHRIASLFLVDNDQLTIKFHLRIHPSLMLVRCDKVLLETMMCCACQHAVARIQNDVKQGKLPSLQQPSHQPCGGYASAPMNRGLTHDVLLSLQPAPKQKDLKFSDIHLMHLLVYDTVVQSPSCGNQCVFMKGLYERYMKQHGQAHARYDMKPLPPPSAYRYCQRIALPYKQCPSTPKVAAFFPVLQQHTELVVKPYVQYFKRYEAISQEYIAMNWHNHNMMKKKRQSQRDLLPPVLPLLNLTWLCPDRFHMISRSSAVSHLQNSWEGSWQVAVLHLRIGVMPMHADIADSACVLIDHQLCAINTESNRHYLQDLILFIRSHGFQGMIAVLGNGAGADGGYSSNKLVSDGLDADITFDWPITEEKLLMLREQCDARLQKLIFPSS